MYAKTLAAYDFRCFGEAKLDFQYPGRRGRGASEVRNVNLILGDNGGGKSSILRAVAIAVLAPVLQESGFVAYRMVRRPGPDKSLLRVNAVLDPLELEDVPPRDSKKRYELMARFESRPNQSRDKLVLEQTPQSPIEMRIFEDYSPAFFVVGYGATRRVETGDFSESQVRRSRGLRYLRVAGLFEDHVPVRPLQSWFQKLDPDKSQQAVDLINAVLPANVRFTGQLDPTDQQYLFTFDGTETPFSSLSDGYKAFVGMTGDLIGHLADVCPPNRRMIDVSGIVLIDEIDLHLHPAWQRTILPSMAEAFPKLQFICTTHSPLVASTVRKENVFVTETAEDGTATIKQIDERVFGQSAEQILLSSYFGLKTTRPDEFQNEAEELLTNAAGGDKDAALAYLEKLAGPTEQLLADPLGQALQKAREQQ